jgi:hypothetical protein
MAMAERWLAKRFNRDDQVLFDYNVYTLCGDGDMMEGISSEAASIAGHLKLENLCWIYDNNTISIEGHTELAFSEDVIKRFQAYGWHTLHVTDANNLLALSDALSTFQKNTGAPTLIVVDSVIGYGCLASQRSAMAMPTLLAHPWPRGPVVVSTPVVMRYSGWPGVLELICRNCLMSSRLMAGWPERLPWASSRLRPRSSRGRRFHKTFGARCPPL